MDLLKDPISETYRLPDLCGGFSGTFTLAYPSKDMCQILGLVNSGHSLFKYRSQLFAHILSKNRTIVTYYHHKDGKKTKKVIDLSKRIK